MSSISSSSLYSVGSSGGISGLMSGMDTEAMVESMLSGTQSKIDAQEALKQQTEWKQDLYRDVITDINDFYSKYFDSAFDSTLETNFFTGDIFNTMMSEVMGDNIKVLSTSTNASISNYEILVNQLATNSTLTSSGKLSGSNNIIGTTGITDETLTKALEKTVAFTVDGSSVAVNLNGLTTENEIVDALNTAFADKGVNVSTFNGQLRFNLDAGVEFSVDKSNSTATGLSVAGLTSTKTADNIVSGSTAINFNAAPTIDVTLDGVTKTINLSNVVGSDVGGEYTITTANMVDALNSELSKAFGDYVTASLNSEGAFQFDINIKNADGSTELGHELKITGSSASLLGVTPGSTSNFNTSMKLSEIATGGSFEFTINGVDFAFRADTSVASMINTINKSDAGVNIQYSTFSDKMTMTATSSGSKNSISIEQTSGDLLGQLFGTDTIAAAGSVSSEQLLTNHIKGSVLSDDYTTTETSLEMTVNGTKYTFELKAEDDKTYTATEVINEFSDWLNTKFDENIKYDAATGRLNIAEGFHVEFEANGADPLNAYSAGTAKENDLAFALGFNHTDTSNVASVSTAVSDVYGLGGIDVSGGPTLGDISSVGGYTASFSNGAFQLSGSGSVSFTGAMQELMGTDGYTFGDGSVTGVISVGQDAKLTINGVETTRSSNLVSFDGISLELTSVTEAGDTNSISTTRNDDVIIDALKGFVEDYNTLITKLNDLVNEDPEYREYAPLTDAQKEQMTDREIELWEEKTQVGLLYNDSTIESFLSSMRSLVYSSSNSSSLALYQIGIETSSFFDDESASGKLTLDEDVLRNALATDAAAVEDLFTNVDTGLSKRITEIVENVANTSSANPGTLVSLAGIDGMASETNNEMYRQIQSIESMIETLNNRYELESTRYWNQFNAMEAVLSQYSSQMNYLAQQFGTGY